MNKKILLIISFLLVTAACSGKYKVVEIPFRGADLYPLSQTRDGITVAVDGIINPETVKKYFGFNLLKDGVMPINVIITNQSVNRCTINPSDVLLMKDKEVIDPIPIELITEIAEKRFGWVGEKERRRIEEFFSNIVLRETVVLPNESYRGVLFFKALESKKKEDSFFSILKVFGSSYKIRIAITDLEKGERIHFGPFSLPHILYED